LTIVKLVLKGHSNLSLAAVLSLSPNTVKVHRRQIYSKLAISSQAELFRLFFWPSSKRNRMAAANGRVGRKLDTS
jgi:DNA-binding CsgD family transcriptional regulator